MGNKLELTGQTFGELRVLTKLWERRYKTCVVWRCKCSCGNRVDALGQDLVRGSAKSCGCRHLGGNKPKEITGLRHGHLVAIEQCKTVGEKGGRRWRVRCDCGNEIFPYATHYISGKIRYCHRWTCELAIQEKADGTKKVRARAIAGSGFNLRTAQQGLRR